MHEADADRMRRSARTLVDQSAESLGWSVGQVHRLVETPPAQRSREQRRAYNVVAGLAGRLWHRRQYTSDVVDGFYVSARAEGRGERTFESGAAAIALHGYPPEVVSAIPAPAAMRFLGLGNVWNGYEGVDRRLLDVGCGAGVDLVAATVLSGAGSMVVGIDKRPDLFGIARTACPRAQLVLGDIGRVPLLERSFDVVVANGLPPLQRPLSLGTAAATLLDLSRPGGEVAATVIVAAPALEAALTEGAPDESASFARGLATLISGKPTARDVRKAFESIGASVSISFGSNPYIDPELRQITALLVVRATRSG